METGFFANAHGQKSTYDSPFPLYLLHTNTFRFPSHGADAVSGNIELLQNTRLTGAQINQVYLSMGKSVDGRRGLDIGGTIDFTWGSDAYAVQSYGFEVTPKDPRGWGTGDYFSAFAQVYVEAEYGRWNVKAGKFYLPAGSNHYKSTENFFYSWASTAMPRFGNPHTAGGVYTTFSVNKNLDLYGGWVMPEFFGENAFGTAVWRHDALFSGFNWKPSKRFNL
jgi:hypothetical protein